ncbi:MAG: hypothetical protein PHS73_00305 [Candidatus Peribacteraceae bacterium]|nr:hypothetical protein [Candidatus Peribacteraceae bacterium]
MDSYIFIQQVQASALIPNTVREVLVEHADDLSTEEQDRVIQALRKAEQENAQTFADASAALQGPMNALKKVTREEEEQADRSSEQKMLPTFDA